MKKLIRKPVGDALKYKGHTIQARYMGPDLLCDVDGQELGAFYLNVSAAKEAGQRYIDELEKENEIKKDKVEESSTERKR